jgi:hypothetical protein
MNWIKTGDTLDCFSLLSGKKIFKPINMPIYEAFAHITPLQGYFLVLVIISTNIYAAPPP